MPLLKARQALTEDAIYYYKQSLEFAKQAKSKDQIALLTDNLASCFEKKEMYDSGFVYAHRSLKEYADIGDKEGMAYAMGYIGVMYSKKNKADSAKAYLQKAYDIGVQLKYKSLIALTASYFDILYRNLGDYKNAYKYYTIYRETTDSINNKKAAKEAIRTQLKYDFEKKELEQQERQRQLDLAHSEELKRQHIIIASVTVGLLLLVVFMFVLASRLRIIRKQNIVIEQQKHIVEEKNKDMTDSIQYASRIQQTILPDTETVQTLFPDSFVLWKPKDIVSGDFYWISDYKGLRFILAADCTGHGVPGALMSMVGAELFNEAVNMKGHTEPAAILNEVRKGIISALRQKGNMGEQKDGMDASLCVFAAPSANSTTTINYAGANNPIWIIKNTTAEDGSRFSEILPDKQPIGIHGDKLPDFTQKTINLSKGDTVYLFSDGFADQFGGPKGKKFKYAQLKDLLISMHGTPLQEQKQQLEKTFNDWKGSLEQIDDVLIIGIRV